MDGYHLTTIIDVGKTVGSIIIETAKDVIDLLTDEQEEESKPKEERQ